MAVHASLVLLAQPLLELGATTTAVAPVRLARLGWIRGDSTNARSSAGFKFQTCVIGMPLGMEYQINDEKHWKRKRNVSHSFPFGRNYVKSEELRYLFCLFWEQQELNAELNLGSCRRVDRIIRSFLQLVWAKLLVLADLHVAVAHHLRRSRRQTEWQQKKNTSRHQKVTESSSTLFFVFFVVLRRTIHILDACILHTDSKFEAANAIH